MRRIVLVLLMVGLAQTAWAAQSAVRIKPASPIATVTPKPDLPAGQLGIPQPVATPICVADRVTLHGDSAGCLYSCNDTARALLAGTGCVFATP